MMPAPETYACLWLAQPGQYYPAPPYQMPPPPPPAAAPPQALRPVAVPQEQLLQTATIRNSVNLKKNSLALVPVDGHPRRLAVTFTFDSSVPCRCAPLFFQRIRAGVFVVAKRLRQGYGSLLPSLRSVLLLRCSVETGTRCWYLGLHTCVLWSPTDGPIRSDVLRVVWWCAPRGGEGRECCTLAR